MSSFLDRILQPDLPGYGASGPEHVIVLHTSRLAHDADLLHVYARERGRVGILLPPAYRKRSRRNAVPPGLTLPLTPLEVVFDPRRPRGEVRAPRMRFVNEARLLFPVPALSRHPKKHIHTLFVAQLLFRVLREPHRERELFDFLIHTIHALNDVTENTDNFPLVFLGRFLEALGLEDPFEVQHLNYDSMHILRYTPEQRAKVVRERLDFLREATIDFDLAEYDFEDPYPEIDYSGPRIRTPRERMQFTPPPPPRPKPFNPYDPYDDVMEVYKRSFEIPHGLMAAGGYVNNK
ncbi:MAG: DNA repair protein RecO C-terminal domain-containing protein [Tannerellaceae bacterium]|nr:DNA repair protein RecO C-terminal domain-containing protein [Tannerellaceae bacterium]